MTARPLRDVFLFDASSSLAAMPVSESAVTSEIQLCRTGAFYRADMGHFKVTQTTLQRMMTNAQERGVDLPINYFHQGSNASAPVADRGAAGWVSPSTLSIRSYKGGYGLFGTARWTAEAVNAIRGQTLKYISPEIVWSDTRMAASESGPAGQPIGASLVGAALVNDPFFNLNPVSFSRAAYSARKRYSMLTDQLKADIGKLLTGAGVSADVVDGLLAQIALKFMEADQMEPAAEAAAEMPAPAAAMPAEALPTGAALAASREVVTALTTRVKQLEAAEASREADLSAQLFERYKAEGRYRLFAKPSTDPDGTKYAKTIFGRGIAFAREVFDQITPLTGTKAPAASGPLPTLSRTPQTGLQSAFTEDGGVALHSRILGELKTQNLSLATPAGKKEYNRLSVQFSRE